MKRFVFGECVQGFSHIQNNMECQDSCKILELEDGAIVMAVADGHGSKSCPYSKTGSEIAVNVFCKVMANTYRGYQFDPDMLPTYLNREGSLKFAQTVDQEWKESVLDVHRAMNREMPLTEDAQEDCSAMCRMYGSTLLGLLIAPSFVFAFQIGDGDITYVDACRTEPVVQGDKLLGVESHSLCAADAWKKSVSIVRQRRWDETVPCFFMLSTDGFANSYVSDQEFSKTCTEYFTMLNEYGAAAVEANLKSWLAETSQLGCGDDITALVAYFTEDEESRTKDADEKPEAPVVRGEATENGASQDADAIEAGASEQNKIENDKEVPPAAAEPSSGDPES